jgi:energy-coupling factor transport system permease protein
MPGMITYRRKDCFIHRLSGFTKLVFFLSWTVTAMLTYDTRVLAVMMVAGGILYGASRTEWKQVKGVFGFIAVFLIINLLAIYFFSPLQGCKLYGSRTVLYVLSRRYVLTAEQLFYELNIAIKYAVIVPSVFIFITATDPSEFAASLSSMGINYKVGYSFSLTLRYIPDIQNDYYKIRNAEEARGIEMSRKAPFFKRVKSMGAILFPLIFSVMDRIDVVSNAMELRGFGKNRKRTWYSGHELEKADYVVFVFTAVFCTAALVFTYYDGSRFWNPFQK